MEPTKRPPIVLRCDDFDPRITIDLLKPMHEEFLKRGIPMTVCTNNSMGHRLGYDKAVLDYVNLETPAQSWDIQLHTFNHDRIWSLPYPEVFMNIFTNLELTKKEFPRSNPTILYPPWNEESDALKNVCESLGLQVVASRITMRELMWNGREDKDCFFWHWWDTNEQKLLPEALDRLVKLNTERGYPPKLNATPLNI